MLWFHVNNMYLCSPNMEITIYRIALFLTGLLNLLMAGKLFIGSKSYRSYAIYYRTRLLTTLWIAAFGIGYLVHGIFLWRDTWPTAASALTATYFHLGAVCFNWGYISLLNPNYLTRFIVYHDGLLFFFGVVGYWLVALLWKQAPMLTMLSFCLYFAYAAWTVFKFYRTYSQVSYRLMRLSFGQVMDFVRWMQVCCDLIVLFGISSVAITGIFPTDFWPYVFLLFAGVGMFGYIAYSLNKYGATIEATTAATRHVASVSRRHVSNILLAAVLMTAALTSCDSQEAQHADTVQADSLINNAHTRHDYQRLMVLTDSLEQVGSITDIQANYWRGYVYSGQRKMRLAEKYWKQAVTTEVHDQEGLIYYAKSANRLAGALLLKGEYEATMKVAVPALERMADAGFKLNSDYAYLLSAVGCCQLKQGTPAEAVKNFNQAYTLFCDILEKHPTRANFTTAIIGVITITENYLQMNRFQEAYDWTVSFKELLDYYRQNPHPDPAFIDKQQARLNMYQASALEGLGKHAEAERVFSEAMKSEYAQTNQGKLEANNYLMAAGHWAEAAQNFEVLAHQMQQYDVATTMDIIHFYLLPQYRANYGAHYTEEANAISRQICLALDSAIILMQRDAAMELTTIYNTQQKERELVEQKSDMVRQRYLATVITLVLVIVCFVLIIYFRHQSAMRLESAYYKLEIANERTKESSRMKSSFIRQISHEIRTPLNILSGFTQVLTSKDMQLDEATREELNEKIMENTHRITELVNKMLELSDVSSKTVIETNDRPQVLQLVVEAVNTISVSEHNSIPVDMQLEVGVGEMTLQTNEHAVTRALILLLDNAERFTHEGSITLKVAPSDQQIQFVVEDTGIGIPAHEAEHIFEEFVQLDEYESGTGIGLTVARSICRRLGGDVFLDTSYTRGARFVMTLPV